MKNVLSFLDKWGLRIITPLILVVFLKTCSTNSRIDKVQDEVEITNGRIDSLKVELIKEIQIEGLKSEKRMIQSTDRKMLDVQRQTEIDKQLSKLGK